MLFKDITILDEFFLPRESMNIGIKEGKINYIGKEVPEGKFKRVYNGKNKILMPGFVNAHGHSPMTLLRGYGENLRLQDWLNDRVFPFEAKLDEEKVYWATLLAMAESIRYGIVSTTDMYFFSEAMAAAILKSGAKNNLSRAIVNFTDEDLFSLEAGKEMERVFKKFNGAGDGKIKIDMSLHAEYTSNPKTVEQLAKYTKEIGANMHVHVSETKIEHEECKRKYGKTPVAYLNDHGLFDTPTTAAHCVYIEEKDYTILRDKGVTVAVNPISNMKLGSGVCNVPKLLENNIKIAIGTDGVASNNSLNFIEEMKFFALVSKGYFKNPEYVTPTQTLKIATEGGALSQGRFNCGKIKVGNCADLIVLEENLPWMTPRHNLVNNIVYSASGNDVCLTMVDGQILYENGEYKTIDIEKTISEVKKATSDILAKL